MLPWELFIRTSNHCGSAQAEFRMNERDCRVRKLSLDLRLSVSGSSGLARATQQVANQLRLHSKKIRTQSLDMEGVCHQ